MNSENENQIIRIIKYTLPLFILFSSFAILIILYYEKTKFFEKEKLAIKKEFIEKNKIIVKEQITNLYNYINTIQLETENDLKKSLKVNINNAHTIATSIYEKNKDKNDKELKKIIIDALRDIRFNDGRGYFFIYDMNAKNIMLPPTPQYENQNFYNHQDSKGKFIIQEMINTLKTKDEAYFNWHWYKPNTYENQIKKIGITKKFKPFDWFIGTGEYVEDFEKEVQNRILNYANQIKFGKNGYIFIIDYKLKYLSHANKNFIGKNGKVIDNTINSNEVLSSMLNIAKKGEGYYSYVQKKSVDNVINAKKTSFIKGLQNWSWILGAGFYENDIETSIKEKENELNKKFEEYIHNTIILAIVLTLLFIFMSISFSKKLQKLFDRYRNEIKNHIKLNTKHQNILAQKSKMAAMGEMIGNIAHQWRQPLSVITTSASVLKLKKELNIIEDQDYNESLETIMKSANYLSDTIDDFRYFFMPHKERNRFNIQETINKLENFIKNDYSQNEIKIIKNIQEITLHTYESELIQVILNILKNAKDELIKYKNLSPKLIFIDIYKENKNIKIIIKDNAGGINEEIIDRLFEPYFTTKHQSSGTGIGLYMSLEIIKKHMQGKIDVKNIQYEYNSQKYIGAQFSITFNID